MSWWSRVFRFGDRADAPPDGSNGAGHSGDSASELREAKELRAENRRHVAAIEQHVSEVSRRVRAEAQEGDRRVRG